MKDDATLLQGYSRKRSQGDFAELVRRHVNLVYSAALRQVNGDAHLAQDVTQSVFTDLSRKAGSLLGHRVLAGWLFTSTRFAAAKVVRSEQRRRRREQEAHAMQDISASDASVSLDWERIRPVLDDAMAGLEERDRDAILLRYMEGCDFAQVGKRLSLSDNAARMRVDRAVDKLRSLLARRGVTSTAGALALALTNQAVVAAPIGLVATVTGAALVTGGGTAAIFTFMSLTKLQLGITSAVIVAGVSGYLVQEKNNTALRNELASIQPPAGEITRLQETNQRLGLTESDAATLAVDDAELQQLRDEAATVQNRLRAGALVAAQPSAATNPSPLRKEIFTVDQLDQKPRLTGPVQPAYPYAMSVAGISGKVVVEFVIDASGKVSDAHVVQSSHPEFEAPTVAAVNKWQFDPGRKSGQRVNTRATQLMEFNLDDRPPAEWF